MQAALDQWGRLDVLVNNAAVTKTIPHQRFDLLDADEFERTYSVNLIGNYQMCRAAAPHLKATGDAAIVNISSIGAMRGAGSSIAYAASKGALNTLTISMARALAPEVRVNALCPGGLLGSWTRKIMTEAQYEARVHQANTEFPLRRGIWPIDVARAALFLIEHAVAMTGECIRMDSGEHLGAQPHPELMSWLLTALTFLSAVIPGRRRRRRARNPYSQSGIWIPGSLADARAPE